MKTPRYTDLLRYPNGWRKAVDTNVAETFARVRAEQEAARLEAEKIVRPIQQKRK